MAIHLLNKLHRIFNHRSTGELKNVTGALDAGLNTMCEDISLLELQYIISTATGEWLDEWGSWFGITRNPGEDDPCFSGRILAAALTPKCTIPALTSMADALARLPGATVFEPYTKVAKHNHSQFSGDDHYQDGSYWRWNVVDLVVPYTLTKDLADIVKSVRAAGIKVYFTQKMQLDYDGAQSKFPLLCRGSQTFIQIEPCLVLFKAGNVLSGNRPPSARSGNKTVWGIGRDLDIAIGLVDGRRYMIGSPLYHIKDAPSHILTNPFNGGMEVIIKRSVAVADVIANTPGVEMFGPYAHLTKHGRSTFSGTDRFPGGTYWSDGVVDITISPVFVKNPISVPGGKLATYGFSTFGGTDQLSGEIAGSGGSYSAIPPGLTKELTDRIKVIREEGIQVFFTQKLQLDCKTPPATKPPTSDRTLHLESNVVPFNSGNILSGRNRLAARSGVKTVRGVEKILSVSMGLVDGRRYMIGSPLYHIKDYPNNVLSAPFDGVMKINLESVLTDYPVYLYPSRAAGVDITITHQESTTYLAANLPRTNTQECTGSKVEVGRKIIGSPIYKVDEVKDTKLPESIDIQGSVSVVQTN